MTTVRGPGHDDVDATRVPRGRAIRTMMVPVSLYARVRSDETVREAAEVLLNVQMHPMGDDDTDRGRRTLLVFDAADRFLGLIRAQDIVRAVVTASRAAAAPHASTAGTFLAHARTAAGITVGEVVQPAPAIEVSASAMQAAELMVAHHLSHLAVTRKGTLVGLLRPEDLYQEVAALAAPDR